MQAVTRVTALQRERRLCSTPERAANERSAGEVGARRRTRQNIIGSAGVEGHQRGRHDAVPAIQPVSWSEVGKAAPIGGGMTWTHVETGSVVEHHMEHGMSLDAGASRANDGHHHDSTGIDAINEIANAQCSDRLVAAGGRHRGIGRRADGTAILPPLPDAILAEYGQLTIETARSVGIVTRCACLRCRHWAPNRGRGARPLWRIDRLTDGIFRSTSARTAGAARAIAVPALKAGLGTFGSRRRRRLTASVGKRWCVARRVWSLKVPDRSCAKATRSTLWTRVIAPAALGGGEACGVQ